MQIIDNDNIEPTSSEEQRRAAALNADVIQRLNKL